MTEWKGSGLMDVGGAADFLHMTPGAIYAAVGRRQIPFLKIGKRLRFRREDLEALIEQAAARTSSELSDSSGRAGR